MLETEHPEIFMGLLDADSLGLLLETITDDPEIDDLTWLTWESAGIFSEDDTVEPNWARVLQTFGSAERHLQLVSIHEQMMFSCEVFASHTSGSIVSVTTRASLSGNKIDEVHPIVEVMLGPLSENWTLVRRAMPPLDEFRADPQHCEVDARIDDSQIDYVGAADTRVHAVVTDPDAPDQPKEFAWALREGTMYRLDSSKQRIDEVPFGELAWTLTHELIDS